MVNNTPRILPVGTQVVTHVDIKNGAGGVLFVAGVVGVIVKAPVDSTHAYRVRFVKTGYNPDPPDLAVEVVSPADELEKKLIKYAEANVLVWVMYPDEPRVRVRPPDQPEYFLEFDDTLIGDDVLPGFTLPVRLIFPGLPDDE